MEIVWDFLGTKAIMRTLIGVNKTRKTRESV